MDPSPGLPFAKASAAGNDFVVVAAEAVAAAGLEPAAVARAVCPRRVAVGADGLVTVGAAGPERLAVRHYEPDGAETFCLNGLRAALAWARAEGRWDGAAALALDAGAPEGPVAVEPGPRPRVAVAPPARLEPRSVAAAGRTWRGTDAWVGNPQFVVRLPDAAALADPDLMTAGRALRWTTDAFPAGANVTFVAGAGARWRIRTYERGVEGETLACGTGTVAAACALAAAGEGDAYRFRAASGEELTVDLERDGAGRLVRVWSGGPARLVARGRLLELAGPGLRASRAA